jgi:uncharacterized protein
MNARRSSFLLALLLFGAQLFALDIPPKPTAWVTDNASLLTSEQQLALNQKLESLFKQTNAQFLIMIFPSLEGEDPVDYTNRVANMWKVKDDKALMLFVFVKDHQMRIQTGYGLEGDVTDAYASRVYRETLVPSFRAEKNYEGLDQAVNLLGHKIDPKFAPDAQQLPDVAPQRASGKRGGDLPPAVYILIFIFIFFVLPMLGRRRGCGGCFWPMMFLGGGGGRTFGGGGGGGGGWSTGGSWGGGGSSFGGGGAGGGW